ncbi:hypothetical protein GTZ99_12945 [Novosphingobium sp. FSY-8]|uniref:17 kDa surface antigen n=1 Tax=Novosphingobium ovatum TaxID=1908523 RepID=A0ABW9XG12_9SPHN|nr:hypothetical protein [Novosphingobium ovatum]NBC37456.1 hypothetical protein [Novosphingobium ovatum]
MVERRDKNAGMAGMGRWAMAAGGLAMIAATLAPVAAQAQIRDPDAMPYGSGQGGAPAGGDYRTLTPPPEPQAPAGYDGSQLPPPPPGYAPSDQDQAQRAMDLQYAREAQRWARDNCVKSKGDTAAGALVGGILGAIVGGGLAGRGDRGGGMAAGAVIGAVGGAAVASSSGRETSPGCPPGYVTRRDAPEYAYEPAGYYYAAPSWYRPWVFVDGYWSYRPYPYHAYYYRTWRGPAYGGPVYEGPRGGYYAPPPPPRPAPYYGGGYRGHRH